MNDYLVVDTRNVQPNGQCPVKFTGTYDGCVAWIGQQNDGADGYYQIDWTYEGEFQPERQ